MKNKLLLTIIFALLFNYLYATPQIRDRVFWNGLEYHSIPSVKLEEHFSEQEVMRLNQLSNEWNVTSNYRGYWFEFEIENDSLYLKGIVNDDEENIMESIIGTSDRKWMCHYSDTMYLGYDESMFDDAFWTMIYESEMTVVFKDGIVQWVKDNQSKSKSSPYLPLNIAYFKKLYSEIQWSSLDKEVLKKKPAVVLKIENDSINIAEKVSILRSSGLAEFDEEAIRVIKTIPLPVSFVKGTYIHHNYQVPIIFDTEKAKKLGVYNEYNETTKTNDTFENQLVLMLQECIKESKNNYESSPYIAHKNSPLLLCSDGLPSTFAEQNKSLYESLGLETMSWKNTKIHQERMIRGIDVMEVRHYLKGNIIEVYIHFLTAKKENNEIVLVYWFRSIDKYVYEYSCETNEWQLIKKE